MLCRLAIVHVHTCTYYETLSSTNKDYVMKIETFHKDSRDLHECLCTQYTYMHRHVGAKIYKH